MSRFRLWIPLFLSILHPFNGEAQLPSIGQKLPDWEEGYFDLHHINTGMGNAAFYIFPDGTTMLIDAGELDPQDERAGTPRNSPVRPDSSRKAYEWIVHYIKHVMPFKNGGLIDYAMITHFHDDHFGSWYPQAPWSSNRKYRLSGITGVGEHLRIATLLDRGYPDYNYPGEINGLLKSGKWSDTVYYNSLLNYRTFVETGIKKGMKAELFRAGSKTQVGLKYKKDFRNFHVRNIKANGLIWTGKDSAVKEHFINYRSSETATRPDENALSNVLTMQYGPFIYYTGGDCGGNIFYGDSPFRDVETPVAKVVGEVDVATLDHHGNRDAVNEFQVRTFKPRVWIGQSWSADHPGHEVLIRMTTPYLYQEKRDIFSTNMLDANRYVIGPLIDKAYRSQQGHIVVRVFPGGTQYYVIILDDSSPSMPVKAVFGPYASKQKSAQLETPGTAGDDK